MGILSIRTIIRKEKGLTTDKLWEEIKNIYDRSILKLDNNVEIIIPLIESDELPIKILNQSLLAMISKSFIFDSMGGELKMVYNLTAERKSLEELWNLKHTEGFKKNDTPKYVKQEELNAKEVVWTLD